MAAASHAPLPPRAHPPHLARRARGAGLALVFCALVAGVVACGESTPRPDGPSVLLVLVDTLRADRLGCQGNGRGLTPRLDRLAAEGVVFENASAHAPWTLPSTASLYTSLYPVQHGAGGRVPNFRKLSAEVDTAASIFAAEGYATAAIVNVTFLGRHFGLDAGFQHLDEVSFENNVQLRDATQTTDAALAWLEENHADPFFLVVHYFDPHAVYAPPPSFRRRFAAPVDQDNERFVFGTRNHMLALRAGKLELDPAVLRRAEALYDGEVAYADDEVGRLLDGLDALGLREDVCVAVTSDHGEEFLDHDGFEHGHTLYEELLHVPLILRVPGLPGAQRVASAVRHVDVLPTLCEVTGIPLRPSFEGTSLLPALRGRPHEDGPALAHGNFWGPPLTSWREGNLKLIVTPPTAGTPAALELYDWVADPGETADLSSTRPALVERLVEGLRQAEERAFRRRAAAGQDVDVSAEHQRLLQGLGYATGADGDR